MVTLFIFYNQADTFIITTKNTGKISHIEIGHDGKGLGKFPLFCNAFIYNISMPM